MKGSALVRSGGDPRGGRRPSCRQLYVMVLLISLAQLHSALASCFKADPTVPPSKEYKVLVDYKQDGLLGFGESPVGKSNSSYPPKLADDTLKPNAGRRMGSNESGKVSYYEPAVGGGLRFPRNLVFQR